MILNWDCDSLLIFMNKLSIITDNSSPKRIFLLTFSYNNELDYPIFFNKSFDMYYIVLFDSIINDKVYNYVSYLVLGVILVSIFYTWYGLNILLRMVITVDYF